MMKKKRIVNPEIMVAAINDGINFFLREILEAEGYIAPGAIDKINDKRIKDGILKISERVCSTWKVFAEDLDDDE
jgi:hypothetical protein